ncbi:MFS transporter [Streptomyces sp. KL116D]|uniref:MFS transporter n=1 Tax=Streptomyces sp. KL116D TaxID=3045152 RepID=UPI0035589E31
MRFPEEGDRGRDARDIDSRTRLCTDPKEHCAHRIPTRSRADHTADPSVSAPVGAPSPHDADPHHHLRQLLHGHPRQLDRLHGLPQIQSAMGFSGTGLSWITNAYVLVFGGLLLLGARAGDLFGHRRMFVCSLVVFALASLLVGAAQSQRWLIGARAFQGVGAAVLAPSALSLLTRSFAEGRTRNRAMAAYSAVAGLGASLGLVVGGLFADLISWRAGFFLNVPVGLVMILLAVRYLPETPGGAAASMSPARSWPPSDRRALVLGIVDATDFGFRGARAAVGPLAAGLAAARRVRRGGAADHAADRPSAAVRRPGAQRRLPRADALHGRDDGVLLLHRAIRAECVRLDAAAGRSGVPADDLESTSSSPSRCPVCSSGPAGRWCSRGVVLTAAGMVWLSRLALHTPYVTGVALPMILIGAGQGLALAPMRPPAASTASPPAMPAPRRAWSSRCIRSAAR